MQIDNDTIPKPSGLSTQFAVPRQQDKSFETMLDAERLKAEVEVSRRGILDNQQTRKQVLNKDDIEFIREHGMRAYAEDVHKQKMEEIREKILQAMGLTEEGLSEMSTDLRMEIEKMIAQEVQKQVAADSLSNGGSAPEGQENHKAGVGAIDPENITAAQMLAGDPGTAVGLMISEAKQELNPFREREMEEGDRQILPRSG